MYNDVSARITVPVDLPGIGVKELPMTQVRAMAKDEDRTTRKNAFDAEIEGWKTWAVPIAAALNSIKGEAATLNARRGYASALEPALAYNNVEPETLDAMQRAVVASFPDFRRYMDAKANLLGVGDHLAFYDLFAPVATGADASIDWDGATASVQAAFAGYSDQLAALARRALDEKWIDAEIREGKGGGAFCMSVDGDPQPRADQLRRQLRQRPNPRPRARARLSQHPIGGPHAVPAPDAHGARRNGQHFLRDGDGRARPRDRRRQSAPQHPRGRSSGQLPGGRGHPQPVLVRDRRCRSDATERALSVAELCDLMADAQAQTYGDALSVDHPYMWAAKPHYYGIGVLQLALHVRPAVRHRPLRELPARIPEKFRAGYDDLLSATGLGSAAALAARFDIDVTDEAFWTASLDVVRARIDDFVALAATTTTI